MTRRGPKAELIEFDGLGHLPALMTKDQIEPIVGFLGATEAAPSELHSPLGHDRVDEEPSTRINT